MISSTSRQWRLWINADDQFKATRIELWQTTVWRFYRMPFWRWSSFIRDIPVWEYARSAALGGPNTYDWDEGIAP